MIAFFLVASNLSAQLNIPQPKPEAEKVEEQADPDNDSIEKKLEERRRQTADAISARNSNYNEQNSEDIQQYNEWTRAYARKAYGWHHQSTVMIFFMVVIVVLSGIVLAAWQLQTWIKRVKAYDAVLLGILEKGNEVDKDLVTGLGHADGNKLELKKDALGISTPYVGVIILGLSMGFFLAYLLFVYPIQSGP